MGPHNKPTRGFIELTGVLCQRLVGTQHLLNGFLTASFRMQNLMERAVVLGYGANQAVASPSLAALVNEYAAILASQVRGARCPRICSSPCSQTTLSPGHHAVLRRHACCGHNVAVVNHWVPSSWEKLHRT